MGVFSVEWAKVPRDVRVRRGSRLGPGQALSEFKAAWLDWLPQHLPCSFPAVYNAWDYAEGRSRPSGRLAGCTYKGAIEMCTHSKSKGRQAGVHGLGRLCICSCWGEHKWGQRRAPIYSGSVRLQKRGRKAMGLLALSAALHLVLHKFAY